MGEQRDDHHRLQAMSRSFGDGLLHPLALTSVFLLVLNDHLLKPHWGGWLTGKLSDFAGLVFFPLLLQHCWRLFTRTSSPDVRVLKTACLLTAVVFSLVKTWPLATLVWSHSLGALQWPFWALIETAWGRPRPPLRPVLTVTDPTDLIALPSIGLALWIGRSREGRSL
jgi:hypothetical protein